jgi:hypothetical protein
MWKSIATVAALAAAIDSAAVEARANYKGIVTSVSKENGLSSPTLIFLAGTSSQQHQNRSSGGEGETT